VVGGADPRPVIPALAEAGRGFLRHVSVPKPSIAAALPVVLARRDLARPLDAPGPRGIGDKLAVTWAALTGRLGLATH
jgi:phytoene synthase